MAWVLGNFIRKNIRIFTTASGRELAVSGSGLTMKKMKSTKKEKSRDEGRAAPFKLFMSFMVRKIGMRTRRWRGTLAGSRL